MEGAATRGALHTSHICSKIDDEIRRAPRLNLTAKQLLYWTRDSHAKRVRGDPVDVFDNAEWASTPAHSGGCASQSGGRVTDRSDATTSKHGP